MNFQKYLNPEIAPISDDIQLVLNQSPKETSSFIPFEAALELEKNGYFEVETSYCINQDGSVYVAVLTDMPNVTPEMWHWWFGWHGDSSEKYKLWHPESHISSEWKDKEVGKIAYIDRVSHVVEYVGASKDALAIQFKKPSSIGLPDFDPQTSDVVYIVARIGLAEAPINIGWLVHQVRKTNTGSEMRSRFWLGGAYLGGRNGLGNLLIPIIRRVRKISKQQASDLLIHCHEEMSHLAKFLPDLYGEYKV